MKYFFQQLFFILLNWIEMNIWNKLLLLWDYCMSRRQTGNFNEVFRPSMKLISFNEKLWPIFWRTQYLLTSYEGSSEVRSRDYHSWCLGFGIECRLQFHFPQQHMPSTERNIAMLNYVRKYFESLDWTQAAIANPTVRLLQFPLMCNLLIFNKRHGLSTMISQQQVTFHNNEITNGSSLPQVLLKSPWRL